MFRNRVFQSEFKINSNYDGSNSDSCKMKNKNVVSTIYSKSKMLLKFKDDIVEYGVHKTLLNELNNIKNTLIISSTEIEKVFNYPFTLLKDDINQQIKFSVERMQLEEFSKILLKDEFISSLISQIRTINSKLNIKEITELLNQLNVSNCERYNEMTRFDECINNKLKLDTSSVLTYNNNSTSSNVREINEISTKAFTLTSASSVETIYDKNENNNIIADLDELVKYINEGTDLKKKEK